MEELFDKIIDSVVDGVSSIFDSGDSIIDSASDLADGISESAVNSLAEGDFNGVGCDYSSLFDIDNQTDSSNISFGNHIDDIYDPHIESAQKKATEEIHHIIDSQTASEMENHLNHLDEVNNSEKFWNSCKKEAELESQRHQAFIDGINKQWEIADRLQNI